MKTYEELEQYLYKVCKYLAKIENRAERDARASELLGIYYKDDYIQEMIAIAEWNIRTEVKWESVAEKLRKPAEKIINAMKELCKAVRKTLEKAGGNDED